MDLNLKSLHTNTTLSATKQIQNIIYCIRHPSFNRGEINRCITLRERIFIFFKLQKTSVHLYQVLLTSGRNQETITFCVFPCVSNYSWRYGIFKVKMKQKASAQEFRKRWAARGPLRRAQNRKAASDCGELRWHLLLQSNKGAISRNVFSTRACTAELPQPYLQIRPAGWPLVRVWRSDSAILGCVQPISEGLVRDAWNNGANFFLYSN